MLHSLLSIFFIFFVIYGIDGFGVVPSEISLRVNQTFRILCYVDKYEGRLDFYANKSLVAESHIKRINDTCIELSYRYSHPVRENFTCRQDGIHIIGDSDVKVDNQMAPVQDFKCRTKDLQDINCSFKQPPSNLNINYNLKFSVDGDKTQRAVLIKDGKGGHSSKIIMTQQKKVDTAFHFNLRAYNKLFKRDEAFDFKLLEILTPREIQNLTILNNLTTFSRALVSFSLPRELAMASEEMIFDVRLKLALETAAEWQKIPDPRLQVKANSTDAILALDDLDFANTKYAVRIRMKSRVADDVDTFWSPGREVSFTTRPKMPEKVPETCDNCFNVMDNGNVVVYWKEVARNDQSGDDFCYRIVISNDNGREMKSFDLNETSMMITRDEFVNTSQIHIKLFSKNREGVSQTFSQLQVPLHLKNSKALRLRKELVDDEYKISWMLLKSANVESFTLFSCSQQANELPNQCDGAIDFKTLPASENGTTVSSTESRQFGVSANFANSVTGFEWAECTAAKPNQIGHVHSLWSTIDAEHSITLHWKLNCVDEPITIGYNISYCILDKNDSNICSEPMVDFVVIVVDDKLSQYQIRGLKSYRLYNASIALMSRTHLGVPATPITVRTMEAAPTAPRDLKAINIAQNSITLTWRRPIEVNGEAMTYQLWYNERKVNINHNDTMNETFMFTLDGLESFTDYTITVVACTSDCSNSSDSLVFKTAISAPSGMLQPKSEIISDNRMLVTWNAPQILSGNLDCFHMKQEFGEKNRPPKLFRISGKLRACIIDGLTCENELNLSIRGVNIEHKASWDKDSSNNNFTSCFSNPEAVHEAAGYYYGDWSPPVYYSCLNRSSAVLIVIISCSLVLMVLSAYLAMKMYRKIIAMKAIHAKLPDGLITTPSSRDNRDVIRDLDLVKDHALNDIDEEEEDIQEVDKLISAPTVTVAGTIDIANRESVKSEAFLPFILNPRTNEITYHLPKVSMMEKINSQETSPVKSISSSCYDGIDAGYTKMYRPQRPTLEVGSPVEGYLDMSGKSTPSPVKVAPSPLKVRPLDSGYTTNEIKMFIQDSDMNNGYIGKRMSILVDPAEKRTPVINSNGYVQQLK